jgi:hypothetical protein
MTFNENIDALEYRLNQKLIPFVAEVAKAIVTLLCLTIKVIAALIGYIDKLTGGEEVAAAKQWVEKIKESELSNTTKSKDLVVKPPLLIPASIDAALGLNISDCNSVNKFVRNNLRPILAKNLLDATSYKAPRNKRCRQGFVPMDNRFYVSKKNYIYLFVRVQ